MRVFIDKPEDATAVFRGTELTLLANYLKPWRNNREIGEWLAILEPVCAKITGGEPLSIITTLEEPEDEIITTEEEMQAEAFRQLGGVVEKDEEEDARGPIHKLLPQVDGHTPEELNEECVNCNMKLWRHMLGTNRCQVNGNMLGTVFLAWSTEDDGAVFARTVGESEGV